MTANISLSARSPTAAKKDIERFSQAKGFPIIPCNLCGSQPNLQRQVIADMLRDWDKRYPRPYRNHV